MSVHRLSDGRWIVKYSKGTNSIDPERTREYFGRGPDAHEAATKRNIELGMGQGRAKNSGPTFREIGQHYLAARTGSLAATTKSDAAYKLDAYIYAAIGDLPAAAIKPEILDQYVIVRTAKGRKSASIHRELTIIRAIIRWAVKRKIISDNPMEGYEFPKKDISIISPPTSAELSAIYEAAAPHLRRAIMLGYYTGIRPGRSEMLSLRWDQVDLINGTIFVESAKKGGMVARTIPIADGLMVLMRTWMEEDKGQGALGTIIHYKGGPVRQMTKSWRNAKAKAGITRRIRLYDLRHLAASEMLAAGADLKSVSEILGHASPDMTLRVYQHTSTALRRDAVSRLGNPLPAPEKIK